MLLLFGAFIFSTALAMEAPLLKTMHEQVLDAIRDNNLGALNQYFKDGFALNSTGFTQTLYSGKPLKSNNRKTLLHLLCKDLDLQSHYLDALQFVLEKKANPNLTDEKEETPLELLLHWNDADYQLLINGMTLLKKHGATFNADLLSWFFKKNDNHSDQEEAKIVSFLLQSIPPSTINQNDISYYITLAQDEGYLCRLDALLDHVSITDLQEPKIKETCIDSRDSDAQYIYLRAILDQLHKKQESFIHFLPKEIFGTICSSVNKFQE